MKTDMPAHALASVSPFPSATGMNPTTESTPKRTPFVSSAHPCPQRVADLIRAMESELQETYGYECSYVIFAEGHCIGAANFASGHHKAISYAEHERQRVSEHERQRVSEHERQRQQGSPAEQLVRTSVQFSEINTQKTT